MGHRTQRCLGSRPLSLSAWFLSVGEAPAVTGQPPAQPVSMVTDASSQLGLGARGLVPGGAGAGLGRLFHGATFSAPCPFPSHTYGLGSSTRLAPLPP